MLFSVIRRALNVLVKRSIDSTVLSSCQRTFTQHWRPQRQLLFTLQPVCIHTHQIQLSASASAMADNRYAADYARLGTSSCKKCKKKLEKGELRIAKVVKNPFTDLDTDVMKQYHHAACIFETFIRARSTTKIIEDTDDIEEFDSLKDEDKDLLKKLIEETLAKKGTPKTASKKKTPVKNAVQAKLNAATPGGSVVKPSPSKPVTDIEDSEVNAKVLNPDHKDNTFRQFRRLCAEVADENGYNAKSNLIKAFLTKGSSGDGFEGDTYMVLKLLLPGVVKTVYNLNNKQLVKIFSQIFGTSLTAMTEDLEQGDVAQTVNEFFEKSKYVKPAQKSLLTIHQVDKYLNELAKYSKEDDQQTVLTQIAKKCTSNDLTMVVRLIKHDIRINAGARHVLDGLDPNAYDAFQASRNLRDVVDRVLELRSGAKPGLTKKLSVRASLMTPVLPMLAEACKSVEMAFRKCPNGMYSEIKYDGERVQVHKQGDDFQYYSRSLKPVMAHKVQHFKDYIPEAFPHGNDLILDSEVLMIDTNTSTPLPFGTLGVHKKQAFKDAQVCLFIFDCLHYNGENLMDRPIKERRKYLHKVMTEVPNRVLFSEMKHVTKPDDLKDMMLRVFNEGLEGLVLKDVNSIYEPGKRHWLKVKKDYLSEGAMADAADLIVLGGYFGTGSKGGIISIFLMGVHDPKTGKFCTVTKCGSGFDDKTLDRLNKELEMVKISKDYTKVPSWLNINRGLVPDFISKDPKKSQVWEVIGAEFSKSDAHTAAGISIRFPRCQKLRPDKTWQEATTLQELQLLYKNSKEKSDFSDLVKPSGASSSESNSASSSPVKGKVNGTVGTKRPSDADGEEEIPKKKTKTSSSAEDDKEYCKYGESCYNDSANHLQTYKHPAKSKIKKPLPDIFKNMKFHISSCTSDPKKLRRYIIAYGGEVVQDYDKTQATRTVIGDTSPKTDTSVSQKWIWKSIKKQKLLPK